MDGTHLPLSVNRNVSSSYFNYKGFTSMNSLVLIDDECRFTYVLSGKLSEQCCSNEFVQFEQVL